MAFTDQMGEIEEIRESSIDATVVIANDLVPTRSPSEAVVAKNKIADIDFTKILVDTNWVCLKHVVKHLKGISRCFQQFSDASSVEKQMRVYQFWPGNNVFFLRGHFICGPDPRGFLLTTVSIVLSTWIFNAYIGNSEPHCSSLIVAFAMILATSVLFSLIMVGTSDPGIIPRNKHPSQPLFGMTRSLRTIVDGIEIKQKYCMVCKLFRPPRSCHCTICNNCVEKFDHHCPWIGQCVGRRNYRFYVVFVFSSLAFFLYILIFSWKRIITLIHINGYNVTAPLAYAPETMALALFSFIASLFLGGLAIFHGYLIAKNQTARENYKERYRTSPNPYDKGIFKNIKEALIDKLPPSNVNFREEFDRISEAPTRLVVGEIQDSPTKISRNEQCGELDLEK